MEYAKDSFLNLKYNRKNNTIRVGRSNLITKMLLRVRKHKMIVSIIFITILMITLDCFLIVNFVNILSTL